MNFTVTVGFFQDFAMTAEDNYCVSMTVGDVEYFRTIAENDDKCFCDRRAVNKNFAAITGDRQSQYYGDNIVTDRQRQGR